MNRPRNSSASHVAPGLRIAAAWSWRLLIVGAGIAVVLWLIATLSEVVVPALVAVLICALLQPFVAFLRAHRWPTWLAITSTLLATTILLIGLGMLFVGQIRSGLPTLRHEGAERVHQLALLLSQPPFNLVQSDYDDILTTAWTTLRDSGEAVLSGVVELGASAGHLLTSALLSFFTIVFVLIDGRGIWSWFVRLFPRDARAAIDGAGTAGWATLTAFTRVQVVVAAGNAIGIGVAAALIGLPLAVPIAVLVFLASFIPVVGAIASGAFAVVIALVFVGPGQALVMLLAVLAVHFLESQVLQPLVMGTAVHVHPLAVVLGVATGSYVAGIPGALFAVPFIATLNVVVRFIANRRWETPKPLGSGEENDK